MSDINTAALIAVRECLGVKENEKVLVITDQPCREVGFSLFNASKQISNDTVLLEITPRKIGGQEPQDFVSKFMLDFDVIFMPTSKSLTHTDAKRNACKKGARLGSLPTILVDSFIRTLNTDYNKIIELTEKIGKLIDESDLAEVKTELGTDIKLPLKNIKAIRSDGCYLKPGKSGNLPGGEAYSMVEEEKANGTIVFDGSLAEIGLIKTPVKATIEDGFCVFLEGGKEADKLMQLMEKFGKKKIGKGNFACAIEELGIGTNFAAKITGSILEDEKVYKTIHIAFGNNITMGGTNKIGFHVDGVIRKPSVWFDGKQVMDSGEFLI